MRPIFLYLLFFLLSSNTLLFASETEQYTFVKLKGKSWVLQKDRFLHYYLMEPGDLFTTEKHANSLALVKEALKNEGYLAGKVTDQLYYDKKNKTVTVTLSIDAGSQYTIDGVTFQLKGAAPNELNALHTALNESLESFIGAFYQKERVDKAPGIIKTVLLHQGFAHPELSVAMTQDDKSAKVTLNYTIELHKKKQFLFQGNHFFSSEQLLEELYALEQQGISVPIEVIAEDVEQRYKSKGFFKVIVDWQELPGAVQFSVYEGKRARVGSEEERSQSRDLVVVHLSYLPSEMQHMNSQIEQVITKFLSLVLGMGHFDEDRIRYLKDRAEEKLVKLGYWDAHISMHMSEHSEKSSVDALPSVTFTMKGLSKRTMIQSIEIKEFPELITHDFFSSWRDLSEPRPLTPAIIEEQRKWLLNYAKERGYLYATADFEIIGTEIGDRLVWAIDTKGGPVLFGPTKVIGLQRMKPYIVERELAYCEGDLFDRAKIEQTVQRLRDLCMFESISIVPERTGKDILPMVIRLREDDPYEVRTRLGFQFVSKSFTHLSWTTYKIGGSFRWKNPAGLADRLILDADLTRYTRDIIASYELPWLGPVPIKTTFKLYSTRFDQPLISNNRFLYKEAHDGFSVTFHNTHYGWMSDLRLGFEFNKLSDISRRLAQEIQFEPALVDRRIFYLYFEPTLTFEHFDNKADPCRGFYTFLGFKAMVPPTIQDGWFIRVLLEQSLFYPLYRSLIGAVRWRVGHIFNARFSTILPTQRFYLGGASSLRGYETNMAPPLNDVICDDCRFWVPVGGKTMVNINTELRFPIYRWFSGVVFTDMGVLTQDRFADIAANKWLGATGFGLRAATPLGPIRFDIGWKWKKRRADDKRYAWFLTFGHAF